MENGPVDKGRVMQTNKLIRDEALSALLDAVEAAMREAGIPLSAADFARLVGRIAFLLEDELVASRVAFVNAIRVPSRN